MQGRRPTRDVPRLRRERGHGPGRLLLLRAGAAFGLLALVIVAFWSEREQLHDAADGEVSLADVIYFSMITITTVGYGDIVPVGTHARLVDAFLVTPVRIAVWMIFLGTAYQMLFRRLWDTWIMQRLERTVEHHVVVCGYGHKGQSLVDELVAAGEAGHEIVVIERDAKRHAAALRRGVLAIEGDARHDEVLRAAQIARARCLVACLSHDDTTTLCVLAARHLNPAVRILAAVRETENAQAVQRAGADVTIPQQRLGGYLLAQGVDTRHVVPALLDLNSARGLWQVRERSPFPGEIGRRPREVAEELVLGVLRGGRLVSFVEAAELAIERDDLLLVVAANGRPAA